MKEIRIHGRGGQGSVTAAILIAKAAFFDGFFAQAFPYFGVERRGAPVASFVRLDNQKITLRSQIYEPDYIIIQDASLIRTVPVYQGLKPGGTIIINSTLNVNIFSKPLPSQHLYTVPMTEIALKIIGKPIVNTMLLGVLAALTESISLKSIEKAIREEFAPELAKNNIDATKFAYQYCYTQILHKKIVRK